MDCLTDRVISAEQGKPVARLARGKSIARWTDGDAGNGNGASEGCPVIRQIGAASPHGRQHHTAGNGADFLLVFKFETS